MNVAVSACLLGRRCRYDGGSKSSAAVCALAEKVNAAYGLNVKRAADDESIPEDLLPKPKYIIKCRGCDAELHRQRLSPLVKRPNRYRCGKCGGRLYLI